MMRATCKRVVMQWKLVLIPALGLLATLQMPALAQDASDPESSVKTVPNIPPPAPPPIRTTPSVPAIDRSPASATRPRLKSYTWLMP